MANFTTALWAYVLLEAVRFGYSMGWDIYNLSRGVYP